MAPCTFRPYDALYLSLVDSPPLSGVCLVCSVVCLVCFPYPYRLSSTPMPLSSTFRPWLGQQCQQRCRLLRCTRPCLLVACTSRWVSVRGFHASLPNSTGTTAQLTVGPLSANVSLAHEAKDKKQSEAQVTTYKESEKKDRESFVCA